MAKTNSETGRIDEIERRVSRIEKEAATTSDLLNKLFRRLDELAEIDEEAEEVLEALQCRINKYRQRARASLTHARNVQDKLDDVPKAFRKTMQGLIDSIRGLVVDD